MGDIWWGNILVNHTGKSYGQGKIWQISYSQYICQIHFCVSVNIGEGNFGEYLTIRQFFPRQNFPVYSNPVWTANYIPYASTVVGYNKTD